jgi:hypothetical protein
MYKGRYVKSSLKGSSLRDDETAECNACCLAPTCCDFCSKYNVAIIHDLLRCTFTPSLNKDVRVKMVEDSSCWDHATIG